MVGGTWRGWRVLGAAAVVAVVAVPVVFLIAGSLRQPGLPPPLTPELVPDPVVVRELPSGPPISSAWAELP